MTTAIDHQPVTGYILGILVFMSLGSFSYGYASAIIATTLGQPSFNEYFELATRSNAAGLIGAMNGLYFAGGFFGVLSFPVVADRWGRKWGVALV
jgi:MFS family permease